MLSNLERDAFGAFRNGKPIRRPENDDPSETDWIRFGLCCLMETAQTIRTARIERPLSGLSFKEDGSPVLRIEREIEVLIQERLRRFAPRATFVGEESGGSLNPEGTSVVVDPIDGTWSFVNGDDTYAMSLAVFHQGVPILGMLTCPATGELAYSTQTGPARLVQLPLIEESPMASDLPLTTGPEGKLLVNLHPARGMGLVMGALTSAWAIGEIQMLKASGGSPVRSMLNAVKSGFCYVNLWAGKPADPFDLTAGVMIVRGAGGDVVDIDCRPVQMTSHRGPFVAGFDAGNLRRIAGIVSKGVA